MFDATTGQTVIINTQKGTPTSPLRIVKEGVTYGIPLVDPGGYYASRIYVKTPSGTKALQMCPGP